MLENQYHIIFPRGVFETSTVTPVFLLSKVTISKVAPKKLRVRPLSFFLSFPISFARLLAWGKGDKIARRGKVKGESL